MDEYRTSGQNKGTRGSEDVSAEKKGDGFSKKNTSGRSIGKKGAG
jgi:hypothetical protein